MYDIEKLNNKKVTELREIADQAELKKTKRLSKQELVYLILEEQAVKPEAFKTVKKAAPAAKKVEEPKQEKVAETVAESPKVEAPKRRTRVRRQNVTASPEATTETAVAEKVEKPTAPSEVTEQKEGVSGPPPANPSKN